MKRTLLACLFFSCATSQANIDPAKAVILPGGKDIDSQTAQDATQRWLGLQDPTITLKIVDSKSGLDSYQCCCHVPSECKGDRSDSFFIYDSTQRFSVSFTEIITPKTSAQEAQKAVQRVSLDHISPDSLQIPGWEVRFQTPTGTVESGIKIEAFHDKRIVLHTQATAFSMIGYKQGAQCKPPADGPMPAGCVFEVRQSIPLDITFDVPIFEPSRR